MRVNISISGELLKKIDKYAEANDYNRSSLIAEALRKIIHTPYTTPEAKSKISTPSHCKHGYMYGLCKFGCQI